ncbi:MAG: GxxExxY protein [Deferribacteres bacterium]|nr:GxxExxY protein [candidate division KSB1 bacterium]MCB9501026.1 GxxExxY protein [Deferribacteres bacterium]
MSKLLYPEESYAIIGACFTVYNEMGPGLPEQVYLECLEIEFEYLGIPFKAKSPQKLFFRNQQLKKTFEPDFICYDKIILEIKALNELRIADQSQILTYLNVTRFELGHLVNFGHSPDLERERFANTR